jgi:two-component system cell cycle sensor histidine kinase/response regulator CckA
MSRGRYLSIDSDRLGNLIGQLGQVQEPLGEPGRDQGGWRLLLEHAPLVAWATDAQLRITSLLGAGLRALEPDPDDLLGVGLEEILAGEPQAGAILEAHRRALAGETVSYQVEVRGRSYRATLEPLDEEGGALPGCLGVALDITQQRVGETPGGAEAELEQLAQAHEELRVYAEELRVQQEELHQQNSQLEAARRDVEAERRRYQELFEFAPDGYLVTDPAGVIRQANRAAAALLGVSQEFLTGKPLTVYLSQEEHFGWYQSLEELKDGKERVQVQLRLRPRGSHAFPAVVTLGAVRDGSGALTGLRCMLRDVSRRVRLEEERERLLEQVARHADELEALVTRRTEALHASEQRFRVMFEAAGLGVALDDLDGHILESNPALQELLGYSEAELRGQAFAEFTHPEDVRSEQALFRELAEGEKERYTIAKRYVRQDGGLVWANLTVSLVRGAEGEPRFAIAMVEDVTEQRRIQEALVRAEKLAMAGRIAASLAHEINNPLQSVIGCLGLAEEALEEGEEPDRYLQVADQELHRIARIVAQLRDLGRPPGIAGREPVDLKTLIESLLTLNRARCESRGVEVAWQVGGDLPEVRLVADQIQQVFLNMLLNALDAMPEGGRLEVSALATHEPEGVQVSFRDSGVGIPGESLPHIFEPFYSTRPDGMGLGLFVSHSVVQDHGGTIEVESQPGQGTTFTVWLPVGGSK